MDPQDLSRQLRLLAGSLGADSDVLAQHVLGLTAALQQAVTGFAGFQLTVVHTGHPVALDALISDRVDDITTSLGLSLQLLDPAQEEGSRAVFYSTMAGALVDLGADLVYVFDRARTRNAAVELDTDLPPMRQDAALTGLDELITLNRAAGVLIDQGHHPSTVHQVLRARAADEGLTALGFALRLLDR